MFAEIDLLRNSLKGLDYRGLHWVSIPFSRYFYVNRS